MSYPERVAAMQHDVEKLKEQNAHLRSELTRLTEAFAHHSAKCETHHLSSRRFFDTKVKTFVEKQINTMQNWTIEKVVEIKKECIGVEERLMFRWRQTNDIIVKVDREQDEEQLMALDLIIAEKQKK